MKLSNQGRYAVRALFDIAFYNDGRPTQVKDIADRQGIPPRFLEQIFQDLKRAGMVGSKRGPQGGYSLLKPAKEISLAEVLRITEGPVALAEAGEAADSRRTRPCRDAIESVFEDLSERVAACFEAVTIEDICERAEQQGLQRPGAQRCVYYI